MTFKSELIFVNLLPFFIAGIVTSYLIADKPSIDILLMAAIILICSLSIIKLLYKRLKAYNFKVIIGLFIYCLCFNLGMLFCALHNKRFENRYFANQPYEYLSVWVNDEPQLSNGILRFQVEVTAAHYSQSSIAVTGKLLVALKVDSANLIALSYGDELLIKNKFLPVEPAYNPGEFDFRSWLESKNIYHQTFINQNQVVKLGSTKGNKVIKYAINERKKQVAIYRKLIKNDEAFAVASTLVLGYRADLSKETLAAYSKTGTIHALSVSGAHVGIIFFLLNAMLGFLDRNKWLKLSKLILIFSLIWYYALITGFSSSVLRSAIMLSVFIISKAINRESNNYNILAFTAFILLFYNPFFIWDVGFQLSFISVFGLIYLQPKIYKWLFIKNKWLDKLWSAVALSLAAQLATFPLSVYYLHQFPVYFIVGNLFILLPLILMMYVGIAILVLKIHFIGPLLEWIITFTNDGLKRISELPFSGISAIWINEWQLLLLSFSLAILIYSLANYKKRMLLLAITLLFIFQTFSLYKKLSARQQRKIIFFSLRKNYAAAFIDGNNAVLLSDLKTSDRNFQFFVRPGLEKNQVTDILWINWNQDTILTSFAKKYNQLCFYNYKILLVDQSFNYKKLVGTPRVNALWLHQNPKKLIADLRTEVIFSTLLIDATNKDYKIKSFEKDAKIFMIRHHTFKKNPSYLINLK